mgnify:CR=1 FL=1
MRLWPQSLFWRLMGVLLTGLLVAQLLSTAINFAERDALLYRSSGIQSAQRIADTVQLLDSLSPAERKRIVGIINVPPQVISLDHPPLAADDKSPASFQTGMFAAILRSELGDDRTIRVAVSRAAPVAEARGPGSGYGRRRAMLEGKEFVPGMYRGSPDSATAHPGMAFRAQVQLRDGSWISFDTQVPSASASLPLRMLATLGILSLAVLVLSYLAVRWITRPLQVLATAADRLGEDIHRPPLPESGPSEVKLAARAFNRMQARLQRLIDDRGRIFSAMSHDLKTPITRMRLRAEMLDDDEQRQRFEKDLQEMEQMVGEALEFLRGLDAGQKLQPVDMMALLESLQADRAEMGQQIRLIGLPGAPLIAMAPLMKRCLNNLIDNAIRYGQRAHIAIEDSAEHLTLRIRDDGPGIPEDQQEKVFEPFYRLEGSRSRETGGTGLGLCIARSIVDAHGGTLTLRNHPDGGLEVSVTLPRRPTSAQAQT